MSTYSLPALVFMVFAACILDRLLGETPRFHPLVGYGKLASRVEQHFNLRQSASTAGKIGLMCWALLVVAPTIVTAWLFAIADPLLQLFMGTLLLYLVIGGRSLQEHAARVHGDLTAGNLSDARIHVSWLVSRDTRQLDGTAVSKACIESVLENGNDALFAPIFWFCLLGPAGAVLYRLANTLDAMWGYRTPRYLHFGRAAAKLDDALNYLPARLTACSYALVGNTRRALACWRTQAPGWDSPNAGPVMAAGAGALQIQLGGAADYHGATEERPTLGEGLKPQADDIRRAQQLVRHTLWLWLGLIAVAAITFRLF
jgi:adenosylcobinamide-phosphate synthase